MIHFPDHCKTHTINPAFVPNILLNKVAILKPLEFWRHKFVQIISKNYCYMKNSTNKKKDKKLHKHHWLSPSRLLWTNHYPCFNTALCFTLFFFIWRYQFLILDRILSCLEMWEVGERQWEGIINHFTYLSKILYKYMWSVVFCFLWSLSDLHSSYSGLIPTRFSPHPFIPPIYSPDVSIHFFLHSWTMFSLLSTRTCKMFHMKLSVKECMHFLFSIPPKSRHYKDYLEPPLATC